MRPADASVAILVMCVALAARPAGGFGVGFSGGLAGGLADSGDPPAEDRLADELGPAKVKRNVRTSEEMRVLISDTGYALEILPNGTINTTTEKGSSPYAVLNITVNKTIKNSDVRRHYTFRGVASGRYLCLSKRRQAFSSKYMRKNRCRFRMDLQSAGFFIVYLYEGRKDRRLQLAITKQGTVWVRTVRTRKQRRHRKRANGGRQQTRRQLPPGASSSPPGRRRKKPSDTATQPARQGSREQRIRRRQQRRRLRRQRKKRRRKQLERQQRRQQQQREMQQRGEQRPSQKHQQRQQQRPKQRRQQRRQRSTRFARRVRHEGSDRTLLPSERVQQGSRQTRRRHQRGRPRYRVQPPPGTTFWLFNVKAEARREALRLERERLDAFAARCRSGSPSSSSSWQQRACGSLRVKRFSAEPPRLTTPESGSPTAAPPPLLLLADPRTEPLMALTSRSSATDTSDARDVSDVRDTSDARDVRERVRPPPSLAPAVSRLDCERRREPGGAARCRQWRAGRRKYKLYLQYRRDLRRHGMV